MGTGLDLPVLVVPHKVADVRCCRTSDLLSAQSSALLFRSHLISINVSICVASNLI